MTQLAGFLFQKLFWILYNISLPSDCLWFKKDCYDLQYETFFKGPGVYLQARRPNSLNVFHLHIKQFWKVMASHLVFCHLLSFPNHQAHVLCFPLWYLKRPKKRSKSLKNAEKWPKPFSHFSDIAYKDKSLGKIPFLKKLTLWFI